MVAGGGWRGSVGLIVRKSEYVLHRVRGKAFLHAVKRRKSDILVARCVRAVSPVLHHVPKTCQSK